MCPDDYGPRYFGAAAFFDVFLRKMLGTERKHRTSENGKRSGVQPRNPRSFSHFQTDIDLMLKNRKVFNIYIVIDRCKQENKSRFDNENIFHYNH